MKNFKTILISLVAVCFLGGCLSESQTSCSVNMGDPKKIDSIEISTLHEYQLVLLAETVAMDMVLLHEITASEMREALQFIADLDNLNGSYAYYTAQGVAYFRSRGQVYKVEDLYRQMIEISAVFLNRNMAYVCQSD